MSNRVVRKATQVPKLAFFDYDKNPKEFEKRMSTKGVKCYYANLNFDLWLLLHKKNYAKPVTNNDDYIEQLKIEYGLETKEKGNQKKKNIKQEKVRTQIIQSIEWSEVKQAIKRAEQIMDHKLETDKKFISKDVFYYDNPSMTIGIFLKKLIQEIEGK